MPASVIASVIVAAGSGLYYSATILALWSEINAKLAPVFALAG